MKVEFLDHLIVTDPHKIMSIVLCDFRVIDETKLREQNPRDRACVILFAAILF